MRVLWSDSDPFFGRGGSGFGVKGVRVLRAVELRVVRVRRLSA